MEEKQEELTEANHNNKICAIYNRYSINDEEMLDKKRKELIKYCTEVLKIKNFVIFEEIKSVLEKRDIFDEMIDRMHKHEFTDLLVCNTGIIYKPLYNREKYNEILNDIEEQNVVVHSITDNT